MHVLHVLNNFGPGGAEMGVVQLIKAFPDKEVRHSVCSLGNDTRMKQLLPSRARCYTLGIKGVSRTAFLSLTSLIRSIQVEIVHVNNLGPWFDCALASSITHCHCIETFHGVESDHHPPSLLNRLTWKLAGTATTSVTSVGQSAARLFSQFTGINQNKIQVFHNGVDTERFFPAPSKTSQWELRKRLRLPVRGLLIGCVGALRPVKNHHGLIRAFAELEHISRNMNGSRQTHLVVVGQGPLETKLKTLCQELGVEQKVIFLGQREEVPMILQALDLFVLNSVTEGMSYAILEAMASGLPVIATAVGGNPELIKHEEDGLLVPPHSRRHLVNSLLRAINAKGSLGAMGQKGRQKVVKYHSLDKMVSAYQSLYEKLYKNRI